AQIYIKQNKAKEALDILEPDLLAAEGIGDMHIIASININLGWALMELHDYDRSEEHLNHGLEIAEKHRLPSTISQAYTFLSKLDTYRGDFENALLYYQKAENLNEEINSEVNRRYVNDLIIKFETE